MSNRPRRTTYLVEHYRPGLGEADLSDAAAFLRDAFDQLEETGSTVQVLGRVLVPADEAFLLLVRASSKARVHEAYLSIGSTFDRISDATTDLASAPPPTISADGSAEEDLPVLHATPLEQRD
jgi:hypothetical protein